MRKTGKILTSLLCIIMLVMTMNVFATEDVIFDEEIIATDELEEIVEEEVELLADGAVCYIGDSIEEGTTYTSLKDAILASGNNGGGKEDVIHLLSDVTWEGMSETEALQAGEFIQ